VLFAVASAMSANRVAHKLRDAHASLVAADRAIAAGDLGTGRLRLDAARAALIAANSSLHSDPWLAFAGGLPVSGPNVRSLRGTTALALQLTDGGLQLLDGAKLLQGPGGHVDVPLRNGVFPVDAVTGIASEMQRLAFTLPADARPKVSTFVVGPVAAAERDVARTAAEARQRFISVGRALDVLSAVGGAGGPKRLLIAVANAAEMRGTGGMILSYGVLTSDHGKLSLDRFGPIDDLKLAAPAPTASVPADYLRRFASLQPALQWRNANLGSDFTFVGPLLESMYSQATGQKVAGVLQVDSEGLAAVLTGIGPVDVQGLGTVTADNVVALTLNRAYTEFPQRAQRQGVLGEVTEAVFRRVVEGDYPGLRGLGNALARAIAGRHVILHMADPATDRRVRQLDAGGIVPTEGDYLQLTVQNFSANKLDYYLDTSVAFTGRRPPGRQGDVEAVIELRNNAPPGASSPAVVFGPFSPDFRAGQYRGLATLYLPRGAVVVGRPDGAPGASVFTEAEHGAIAFAVDVPAGQTRRIVLHLRLPPPLPGPYSFELVPSPRVRPTTVKVDLDVRGRHVATAGTLDRRATLRPG
jgi:hypothetical protein